MEGLVQDRGERVRGQSGFSLVEVLVCILLAGSVVMSIAYGMLTLMRVNKMAFEREQIQLAINNFTERLKVTSYIPCAGAPAGQPSAADYNSLPGLWVPERGGMTATVTAVEYWDDAADRFSTTCPSGPDQGTQRLTVEVSWRGRSGTGQVVIETKSGSTP